MTEYCSFCRQPSTNASTTGFVCIWCGKSNVDLRATEAERVQRRIAETPYREAERAGDREMWELAKCEFHGLSKDAQDGLSAWSESTSQFSPSADEDRSSQRSFDDLVQEVDDKTSRAVEVFLRQATLMLPIPVEISTREVRVTIEGERRGLFRVRGPARDVTRTVGDRVPGHRIFSWFDDHAATPEGPRDPRSQDLYVLTDGIIRLHGGYQYWQVQRCRRLTAGCGQLPGFLSPDRSYTRYGPLIPGLPHEIAAMQKTAVWLEARLRERVARSSAYAVPEPPSGTSAR